MHNLMMLICYGFTNKFVNSRLMFGLTMFGCIGLSLFKMSLARYGLVDLRMLLWFTEEIVSQYSSIANSS